MIPRGVLSIVEDTLKHSLPLIIADPRFKIELYTVDGRVIFTLYDDEGNEKINSRCFILFCKHQNENIYRHIQEFSFSPMLSKIGYNEYMIKSFTLGLLKDAHKEFIIALNDPEALLKAELEARDKK